MLRVAVGSALYERLGTDINCTFHSAIDNLTINNNTLDLAV